MTSAEGTGVTGSLFDRGSSARAIRIDSGSIKLSNLSRKNWIGGPPGTGKTHAIEQIIGEYYGDETEELIPSCIYVTYSRSMAAAARRRIRLDRRHVGTLHSILTHMLGWNKSDFLTDSEIMDFCFRYGLKRAPSKSTDEDMLDDDHEDDWSVFYAAYDYAAAHYPRIPKLSSTHYQTEINKDLDFLSNAYARFKQAKGKHDYTDILLAAAEAADSLPPLRLLIVDEAQDLTPIMWHIIRQWSRRCERVVIAGDDDQGIYRYRGAYIRDFLAERNDSRIFHLNRSYRLRSRPKELADHIIMPVMEREIKEFAPRTEEGEVNTSMGIDAFLKKKGEKWILCRQKYVCRQVADMLEKKGVVFLPINNRHESLSPWTRTLVKITNILHNWPPKNEEDIIFVAKLLPASVMKRGIKTAIEKGVFFKEAAAQETLDGIPLFGRMFSRPIGPEDFLRHLKSKGKAGMAKKELIRSRYRQGIADEDIVRLDTFHASKGGETEHVLVVTNVSRRVLDSLMSFPDDERRVIYVAVTRSRDTVSVTNLGITAYSYPSSMFDISSHRVTEVTSMLQEVAAET